MKRQTRKSYRKKKGIKKYKRTNKKRTNKQVGRGKEAISAMLVETLQNKERNLAAMLAITCKNPDNCLAFGSYIDLINRFFENFKNLNLVDNSLIRKIGDGNNGFIFQVPFTKNNYTAYTVLKCEKEQRADNLFYEYYVGKYFINNFIKKLPTFVETYWHGVLTPNGWKNLLTTTSPVVLKDQIQHITAGETSTQWGNSCNTMKFNVVLIQHFNNFDTFDNTLYKNYTNIEPEIGTICYQVYYALVYLNNKYTHYDLHTKNVCLYKAFPDKGYILMKYHRKGKVFEFKSEYIAKIIDYGRNYFNTSSTKNSTEIIQKVCRERECRPDCGENFGYGSMNVFDNSFEFITSSKSNMSHDIRLIKTLFNDFVKLAIPITLRIINKNKNGTPETIGQPPFDIIDNSYTIRNIFDVLHLFEDHLFNKMLERSNEKYDATWVKRAEMTIYDDGRDYQYELMPDTVPEAVAVIPEAVAVADASTI